MLNFLNTNNITIKLEFGWMTCSNGTFKISSTQVIKFKENLFRTLCSGICQFLGMAQKIYNGTVYTTMILKRQNRHYCVNIYLYYLLTAALYVSTLHERVTGDCNLLLLVLVNIQYNYNMHLLYLYQLLTAESTHETKMYISYLYCLYPVVSHNVVLMAIKATTFQTHQFNITALKDIFKKLLDDDPNMVRNM
jgi:hypothetical protein